MSVLSNSSENYSAGEINMEKSLRGKRVIGTVDAKEDYRESHHTSLERERRKKIRLYLRELQDLVPSVHHIRADKATIVEETIKYIKTLEDVVEKLEKIKRERLASASNFSYPVTGASSHGSSSMATQRTSSSVPRNPIGFQTWVFPNVTVNIFGEDAQFSMCFPNKPDLYRDICNVILKHNIKILSVSISTNDYKSSYKIHAHAKRQNLDQRSEARSSEETFKKAATEIDLLPTDI